ncbi:MAG TPA: serine hydrolase [Rhizomicrobium sp.]|nr:serine hydrolase [Rhizomicrobium sp.]
MSKPTGTYQGRVVGTIANGIQTLRYFGLVQDQWTGAVLEPNEGTLWSLGSCTKSFTATLLGFQAAQASAPLYPLIAQYLTGGDIPIALADITLEQLASMHAGLPSTVGAPLNEMSTIFTELLNPSIYRKPIPGRPPFFYSDLSYALLSFATVALAGSPPSDMNQLPADVFAMMQREIFAPLAMPSATFYPPARNAAYNFPYGNSATGPVNGGKSDWPPYDGAGALYMTAPDLMTWLAANMAGAAGPLGTVATFVQSDPRPTNNWLEGEFVMRGWFAKTFAARGETLTMVDKNGDIAGFHCGVAFLAPLEPGGNSDYGVFVACNYEQDTIPLLEQNLAAIIAAGTARAAR